MDVDTHTHTHTHTQNIHTQIHTPFLWTIGEDSVVAGHFTKKNRYKTVAFYGFQTASTNGTFSFVRN